MVNYTDIILVTINYRLGALGFLVYGSNLEIGGNYGLKVLRTLVHIHTRLYICHIQKDYQSIYICGELNFVDFLKFIPMNTSNHMI